jgi:hypothetical protein
MKKILVSLMGISLLATGCASERVEARIAAKIHRDCRAGAPCTIRLADVTDFAWDRVCVFGYGARAEQIERAIGTAYPNWVEFTRPMIFLSDARIVYSENAPDDVEQPIAGGVYFDVAQSDGYRCFTPESAIYRVERVGRKAKESLLLRAQP